MTAHQDRVDEPAMEDISTLIARYCVRAKARGSVNGLNPADRVCQLSLSVLSAMNHKLSLEYIDRPDEYEAMVKEWVIRAEEVIAYLDRSCGKGGLESPKKV